MAVPDLSWEKTFAGQVQHASDKYLNSGTGTQAATDETTRQTYDDSPHTAINNSQLPTTAKPYLGANIMNTAETGAKFEKKVFDKVQAGTAFAGGGPIAANFVTVTDYSSAYVDFSVLGEASKETGQKFF